MRNWWREGRIWEEKVKYAVVPSSSLISTHNSSMISDSPMLLKRGLVCPEAMISGDSPVRNSAILATPWLLRWGLVDRATWETSGADRPPTPRAGDWIEVAGLTLGTTLYWLSVLLIALDDSKVRDRRLQVVNAITTAVARAREQAPMMLIALPVGILSALRPRSLLDRVSMIFVLIGISAHPIWIGLILAYFLGFKLGAFPISGYCDFINPATDCGGPVQWAYHMFLPWMTFMLLFGMQGWFGPWLKAHDIRIAFTVTAVVLATRS